MSLEKLFVVEIFNVGRGIIDVFEFIVVIEYLIEMILRVLLKNVFNSGKFGDFV